MNQPPHLYPAVPGRGRDQTEPGVELGPELQATPTVKAAVPLLGRHAEGNGGEELSRFTLALPIVGRAMAHLGRTLGDGVEDLECGHQLPGPVHLHLDAAPAHLADERGKSIGAGAKTGEILRPGGDHLPLVSGIGPDGLDTEGRGAQRQGGTSGLLEEIATLHLPSSLHGVRCEVVVARPELYPSPVGFAESEECRGWRYSSVRQAGPIGDDPMVNIGGAGAWEPKLALVSVRIPVVINFLVVLNV